MIIWGNFFQKSHFLPKTEEMNIIIKFHVFEVIYMPKFGLNNKFDYLDQI